MKKSLLTGIAVALMQVATAQYDVFFQIHHVLGDNPFELESTANNNLDESFSLTRMAYYMSDIMLVHDGGQETAVSDSWQLIDAGNTSSGETFTEVYLGSYAITSLEGIRFGIGVDEAHNHLDPATYPMGHPLAPQSPSMHWGWAAGYRFVALEGSSGDGLTEDMQVHALGDINYRLTEINTAGFLEESNNSLYISLQADYTQALKDISIADGLFNHGETDEAADVLWNFHYHVFTETEPVIPMSADPLTTSANWTLQPNPANQFVTLNLPNHVESVEMTVYNSNGIQIYQGMVQHWSEISIESWSPGLYVVMVRDRGDSLSFQNLLIQR